MYKIVTTKTTSTEPYAVNPYYFSGSESCRPCIVKIHKYKIIIILTITHNIIIINIGNIICTACINGGIFYVLCIFVLHANAGSAHLGRPVWMLHYPTNHFHLSRYWTKSFGTVSARHLSPPAGISAQNTILI